MRDFKEGDIVRFITDEYNLTCERRKTVAVVKEVFSKSCIIEIVAMMDEKHYKYLIEETPEQGVYHVNKSHMKLYQGEYDDILIVKALIEKNTDYYARILKIRREKRKNKQYNIDSFLLEGF